MIEMRKDKRFVVDGNLLWLSCSFTASVGRVVDIGAGGLAFHYSSDKKASPHAFTRVTIFDRFSELGTLDISATSDIVIDPPREEDSLAIHRRGAKFIEPDRAQRTLIEHVIRRHCN